MKQTRKRGIILLLIGGIVMFGLFGCGGKNTLQTAPAETEATLDFASYDGGGPEFSVSVEDPQIVAYTSVRSYHDANHEELDGASFTERFTFTGLQPGTTAITVSARSPLGDNEDRIYRAEVDKALHIRLTLQKTVAKDTAAQAEIEPVF